MFPTARQAPGLDAVALLRAMRLFLLLLVCGDLVYMAIHIGYLTVPGMRGAHYSLETDGGLAEFYQYMKQLWLAVCLMTAFLRRRHLVLLAWSGFFGFLLLDDALQLHERGGLWLGRHFGFPAIAGLRPEDLGELIVAGVVGASLLVVLAIAWWRDREPTWRLSKDLLVLTAALGACGVLVDSLHVVAYFRAPMLSAPLAFVEDGGELLIVSLMTAWALDLALRGTAAPAGIWRLLFGERRAQPDPSLQSAGASGRPDVLR
jgi:hypothetical protein